MLYTTFEIKGKEYKAKITAKGCIDLERKLGCNPLNIFTGLMSGDNFNLPSIGSMLTILHIALQPYEHGLTMDKVYDIYDDFVEEGKNIMDLIPIVLDIYKVSGLLPEEADIERKNA